MADRRLVEYHLERLKNKRAEVRLDAIRELGLLGDPSVLEALEQVYRADEDPDVRKAAQAAGRSIFGKNSKA